jgi:hypothetical protein
MSPITAYIKEKSALENSSGFPRAIISFPPIKRNTQIVTRARSPNIESRTNARNISSAPKPSPLFTVSTFDEDCGIILSLIVLSPRAPAQKHRT